MEFPKSIFVTREDDGYENAYLLTHETAVDAVEDSGAEVPEVAEYHLFNVRKLMVNKTTTEVVD